ncbi:DNA polymerase phi-domain-containing protein [Fomitopsis serialis]|uniref:DNA polymerase phi-domain-containing protein n=1 Tax=Fomitopsis serialis TaxID=139415 RepID=UPI002008ABE2|nr:DNA polymerase phi-domain-containing protein [Neoantrodia serialis]KAH9926111.1 DNA polymerase phi-domain-containing protein [Neoantrodia serialis]
MSTTLPLFWDISSASPNTRINASVKLVNSLEHFQSQYVPKQSAGHGEDDDEKDMGDGLGALNARDVAYSIRRLVRGLASPRESSRLGFAVALTELLSRIDTVTCSQIVALLLDSSQTQGLATGQEERDMLFARLFGLISVIQSGLLFRDTALPSSSSLVSSLDNYKQVLTQLVELGEKKSWLRESAWWAIGLAIDALQESDASWKDDALESTISIVFAEKKSWTPEKIAITLKLQSHLPSRDWEKVLSPTFKNPELLSTGNLGTVARILKESSVDDDEESDVPKSGAWKPQVHFVWDMLLDRVLSPPTTQKGSNTAVFPDFFRIVVDESLFSSTSSPERKYWGFQIFTKALPRLSAGDMPMVFTKNFMRSWINHLSNSDRYLHKAARQVVSDIQSHVKENPTLGFTLILQLTGVNGSRQFDKLTKTKTVESILTSMDKAGIQSYIDYLLKQVNDVQAGEPIDAQAVNSRRTWIIDQLAALVRNGAIPKSDDWVQSILDWLTVHGLFAVTKKSEKSPISALHSVPVPQFSDDLRKLCRDRLLSCLADLTGQATVVEKEDKSVVKMPAAASDGRFWVDRVLSTIEQLEKDTKHVAILTEVDEEDQVLRVKARQLAARLQAVPEPQREAAKGAELLLSATLLQQYCAEEEAGVETLESCIDGATRMFPAETKKSKKSRKSAGGDTGDDAADALEPVDVLVDNVIGFLEQATAYLRAVANQVFLLLSGSVKESTISLILTQLERRDPAELMADEDEETEDDEDSEDEEEDEDEDEDSSEEAEDGEEDADEEEDLELRKKIEEALRINGVEAATGESDDESEEDLMDDDQMLAIDEQLAAVFRARATEKKSGKDVDAQREATHFKNRVLDLLEIFLKKQPSSHLTIRLILPLVDLVVGTGPDERQLADKATSVLRSRVGKARETPSSVDKDQAAELLQELHSRARKAPSADVLATLSACSIYVARALHNAGEDAPIAQAYRESLSDFVTRKASRLNAQFFQDLVRRQVATAWALREDLLDLAGKAVNVYRQCQAFLFLQLLIKELPQLSDHDVKADILIFFPKLRTALLDVISQACDASDASLTAAQVKELLKLGVLAVRHTRRMSASTEELATVWSPPLWNDLASKLAASPRLKSSTGLQSSCKEIARSTGQSAKPGADGTAKKGDAEDNTAASKRKAGELEEAPGPQKAKHKKAKKAKAS